MFIFLRKLKYFAEFKSLENIKFHLKVYFACTTSLQRNEIKLKIDDKNS